MQYIFSSFTVSQKTCLRETVKLVKGASFHLKELYMSELSACETVKAKNDNFIALLTYHSQR